MDLSSLKPEPPETHRLGRDRRGSAIGSSAGRGVVEGPVTRSWGAPCHGSYWATAGRDKLGTAGWPKLQPCVPGRWYAKCERGHLRRGVR